MSDKITADKQLLFSKIIDSFPGMYITLISIFQSAMVGYLVVKAEETGFNYLLGEWLRVISTCISIILIWNEYRMGSTVLRWIPNIIDVLIPFALVFGQVLIISNITTPDIWFLAFGLLFFFGLFAYLNMYQKSEALVEVIREKFPSTENYIVNESLSVNTRVLESVKSYKVINPVWCSILSIFHFCAFLTVRNLDKDHAIVLALTVVSLALNIMFFLRGEFYWNKIISEAIKPSIND